MRSLLVLLVLLTLGARGARADEVPVELAWAPGRPGPARSMTLPMRPTRPDDLVPPAGLVDGRFAFIRWGEGPGLGFALDVAPGRERLWVDTDLDSSLEDEEALPWFPPGTAGEQTVTVRAAYADAEAAPPPFAIRLARGAGWAADRVQILPQVHRRGQVELGGRLRAVVLLDDNADMRFDDPAHDFALVDLDGDGTFQTAGGRERVAPGETFRLGQAGWRLEVEGPAGRTLRFVSAEAPPVDARPRWPTTAAPKAGQPPTPPAESLALLKERLESERFQPSTQRLDTVRKLGRVTDDEARDLLLALAERDPDIPVRAAAVRALGNPAWLDAVGERLLGWSTSGQPAVATAGLEALHAADHPRREAVYREVLAGSSSAPVIGAAARHLAYLGRADARDVVVAAFRSISDARTRHQIYLALRTLPDGPPEDVARAAARSPDGPLAADALRDLDTLQVEGLDALALEVARTRPMPDVLALALADVLGARAGANGVRALLALAPGASPRFEQRLVDRLAAARGAQALEALRSSLDAEESSVRQLTARILGRIPLAPMTAALVARLGRQDKKDVEGTLAILTALGEHADPTTAGILLKHAKSGADAVHAAALRALARLGMQDPRVREHFLGLLKARDWEDRVLALDATGAAGEVAFLDEVAKNLRHARWQVRLAAAEALGKLRTPASIPVLMGVLQREEESRVRDGVAASLYGLTGMNLYDDFATWTRWWKEHETDFRIPDRVEPLPPRHAGGTTAGFYGIPLRSDRIAFVVDQSGSMSASFTYATPAGTVVGTRLDIAIRELLEAVAELGDKDRVNVILFHTTVHPWRKGLQRLSPRNRQDLGEHLRKQKPMGGTNLFDALELALQDPDVKTVFLLSDGAPGAGKYVTEDDILREVGRLNQTQRTAIHTIAIGQDSSLMRRLAEENDGIYILER